MMHGLTMHKRILNGAHTTLGLQSTQMMATLFDGIVGHTAGRVQLRGSSRRRGWTQAMEERHQRSLALP
jgi:hypothetical protein